MVMLRKLMKHELYALFRILVFFAAAVVVFAVIGRLLIAVNIANGDADGTMALLLVLVIFFYATSIMLFVGVAWGLGISRFYKTLFTGEGYMTLALPAKPTQIVGAKMLSAFIAMAFASVVSALSLLVFFIGWNAEIMRTISEALSELAWIIGEVMAEEPLLTFEFIVLGLVMLPMSVLVVYAVISVGQLFTAHRKGLTLLLAFGVYIVGSVLSATVLNPILERASEVSPHLSVWINIILVALIDVGCWFLVRYILKNKVNLIA